MRGILFVFLFVIFFLCCCNEDNFKLRIINDLVEKPDRFDSIFFNEDYITDSFKYKFCELEKHKLYLVNYINNNFVNGYEIYENSKWEYYSDIINYIKIRSIKNSEKTIIFIFIFDNNKWRIKGILTHEPTIDGGGIPEP